VEDGIADLLRLEGVAKRRTGGLSRRKSLQEVGDLVDESRLVSDRQARNPPVLHVRLVAVGYMNAPPTADSTLVAVVEVFESMQVVQIPADAGVFAIDLERVKSLVPAGVAGRLEQTKRTILEMAKEGAGVVDIDFLDLAREVVFPLLDECFRH